MPSSAGGFVCPCCGWPGLTVRPYERWSDRLPVDALPPYENEFGAASYEVCSCCGFEFGNDDNPGNAPGVSFERYRSDWIARGSPWFDKRARPHEWSLDRQLAAAGLDAVRRGLPPGGRLSGRAFVDELARSCPETRGLIRDHLAEYDGELLLHLLVADVRRFVLAAFEECKTDLAERCLAVIATALNEGNDYLRNAIAVSFVEDTGWWDDGMASFIASWPAELRAEADYQRRFDSNGELSGVRSRYQVVRDVVRGDRPIEALAEVGIHLERTEEGHRVDIPAEFHVALPLVDLACGLLAMGARGALFREWASALVAVSDIEFHGIDSEDGEALLDGLWTAAAGGDMSERSLNTARRLTK